MQSRELDLKAVEAIHERCNQMSTAASQLSFWTLVAALVCGQADGNETATAVLHADRPGPVISRYIYSQFSEHLGRGIYDGIWVGPESDIPNVRGIRTDVVKALKAIQVPIVRWPGGCFADEYDWRDGIGPRANRPMRKNHWWGITESNAFGTHEFMDFVEQIGAEAFVSVNVGSSTPREMRDWMEYMTSDGPEQLAQERRQNGREKPWKVAIWGIGNENVGCGGNMTPEHFANLLRQFMSFTHRSLTSPSLYVSSGTGDDDYNYTDVVMKSAAQFVDGISWHYYTRPTSGPKGYATGFSKHDWVDTLATGLKIEQLMQGHLAAMDRHDPTKRVGLFIDEWGAWYEVDKGQDAHTLYQQNSLRDAVLAAATLNVFHHHADRVKMTSIAQTVNVLQSMILTKGASFALTPTYHTFRMYLPFHDATSLSMELESPQFSHGAMTIPALSASAARAKDGRIYLAVTNLNPDQTISLSVDLKAAVVRKVSGELLTANSIDAHNIPGEPEAVSPVAFSGARLRGGKLELQIPARSVVVVSLY